MGDINRRSRYELYTHLDKKFSFQHSHNSVRNDRIMWRELRANLKRSPTAHDRLPGGAYRQSENKKNGNA